MAHGDITHVDIPVSDLKRAQEFYSGLFGWQIATYPGFEDYPMWQAPNKVSGGGLAPRSEEFTQPRSYVVVDSIDETLAKAVEQGATIVMEKASIDENSAFAAFADPDGNHIGLYESSGEGGAGG